MRLIFNPNWKTYRIRDLSIDDVTSRKFARYNSADLILFIRSVVMKIHDVILRIWFICEHSKNCHLNWLLETYWVTFNPIKNTILYFWKSKNVMKFRSYSEMIEKDLIKYTHLVVRVSSYQFDSIFSTIHHHI
jgi:hypothetical protein